MMGSISQKKNKLIYLGIKNIKKTDRLSSILEATLPSLDEKNIQIGDYNLQLN